MPSYSDRLKSTAKTAGKIALTATIAASYGAKYGLNFGMGLTKVMFGGAQNLANQFAPGMEFGLGKYLLSTSEKVADYGIDKTIALQKYLKGQIR